MSRAKAIEVSDRQRQTLERWISNKAGTSFRLVERARIILMSADGMSTEPRTTNHDQPATIHALDYRARSRLSSVASSAR